MTLGDAGLETKVETMRGKEALMKYDEALTYAPNWAPLKQARAG
jgi:hypothetical protein